jgi:hypothetical protein
MIDYWNTSGPDIYAAGFKAGAEAMQEAAAQWLIKHGYDARSVREVRCLPLPEPPK